MRISGGVFRGRTIRSPRGTNIRPTPEHVRQALFDILRPHGAADCVLDLYAGTGILSFEAISRGTGYAVLVDRSTAALRLIRTNASLLGVEDRIRLVQRDLRRGVDVLENLNRRFDLVFLDPPYEQGLVTLTLESLASSRILRPDSLVVAEHSSREVPPASTGRLTLLDRRSYGQSRLSLFTYT